MNRRKKGGWGRSWDTLRNAQNVARAGFTKAVRNAKPKEWSSLTSECTSTNFTPGTVACSPASVLQAAKLDLIGPNSASTALDILNVHAVDLKVDLVFSPAVTNQCTATADAAAQTSVVRWGLLKYNAKQNPSPEVVFQPFANATNFMTDANLILKGESVILPQDTSTIAYNNSDDCIAQMNSFIIGSRTTGHHVIRVQKRFSIPVSCREDDGLCLLICMKSFYTATILPFDYTTFGRMRVSFS